MVGFQTVIWEGNNAVQLAFEVGFFSYEIALVIVAEGDIKFPICVALSLSSVFHKKTPPPNQKTTKTKRHFTAISTRIISVKRPLKQFSLQNQWKKAELCL